MKIQTRMIYRTGHLIETIEYEAIFTFKRTCSCRIATFINRLFDNINIIILGDLTSTGDLLMTIIYRTFEPMGKLKGPKIEN